MNDILAPALFEPHVGRTAIATEPSKGPVARRRAVTVGGGHGQAAMLEALLELDCDVTAVVSVADDGGCSGRLRRVSGMPPPGDLRRCLSTLAADRELAARFETRLEGADELRRSVGNLILYEAYLDLGSLSAAVRWAQGCLACRGRVLPVADVAGTLTGYDRGRGVIAGESTIERVGDHPMVASVHGPQRCVPEALEAIREADVVVLGPGSFVTSTLAA
ncbi:MAG: 2-phospho-L-lactate transferase CofD family protein, partial [Polyangiaceae bacterium]